MIKLKINTGALKVAQNTQSRAGTPAEGLGGRGSASSPPPPPTPTASGAAALSPSTPGVVPKIRFKNLKPPTAPSPSSSSKPSSTTSSKPSKTPSSRSASTTKSKPVINTTLPPLGTTAAPPKTPKLKLKPLPPRPRKRPFSPGLGYDSEASDREEDPLIEEQFILRMPPGPDCTYLHHLIETKTLDTSSDVFFKFVSPRTAVVGVRGNLYSALLVDLPCILESVKTLDKKNVFKTADVCQMLLVGGRVQSEEEVRLPAPGGGGKGDLGGGWKMSDIIYPHGITPPLQFVRKRRFRKRVSNRTIEAVEAEVDRLLAMDQEAESSKYEVLDAEQLLREEEAEERRGRGGGGGSGGGGGGGVGGYSVGVGVGSAMAGGGGDGYHDEDAEGEEDYEMDEDDLALQMESALMGGEENVGAGADVDAEGDLELDESTMLAALGTPNPTNANTSTTTPTSTPTNLTTTAAAESEDEDEDEDEDAGSASDAEGEIDESAQETAAQSQKIREEIADLEVAYKSGLREMEKMQNPIMRARKQAALERIVKELEFKRSTLGVGSGSGVGEL